MDGSKLKKKSSKASVELVSQLILLIRGHKIILDSDLAALYGIRGHDLG